MSMDSFLTAFLVVWYCGCWQTCDKIVDGFRAEPKTLDETKRNERKVTKRNGTVGDFYYSSGIYYSSLQGKLGLFINRDDKPASFGESVSWPLITLS